MYSDKKYTEKASIFHSIRADASALNRAGRRRKQFVTWNAANLEGVNIEHETDVTESPIIEQLSSYFATRYVGGQEYICQDDFRLGYHVYGDLEREAMLGENTASINLDLTWEKLAVEVDLYPGIATSVVPNEKLQKIEDGGLQYRDEVAKFTRWNRNDVQRLNDEDMRVLMNLLHAVVTGQNKFTRLVKGFLVMLDCAEAPNRRILVNRQVQRSIVYNPANVLGSFNVPDRAYLWCSEPGSEQYVATLLAMGEAYPPAFVQGSHVTVPADANEVFLVYDGQAGNPQLHTNITPESVYSSILRYAKDVGVMAELQSAMICACSLRENRYFNRMGLPKVMSLNDLLIPGLEVGLGNGSAKPFITKNQGRSIGRVHQLLSFMVCKDLISAAIYSTSAGLNAYDTIKTYLSTQEHLVGEMGFRYSDLGLLEATKPLRYLTRLDQDDCDDIASLSIFEALWLCGDAKVGVANGVLQAVRSGIKDTSDDTSSRDILLDELRKGGIVDRLDRLPTGRFTTEGSAIEAIASWQLRNPKRHWKHHEMVFPCDHKPDARQVKRKERIRTKTISPRRRVPLVRPVQLEESPPATRRTVRLEAVAEPPSSPPVYSSESKSSEYYGSPPVSSHDRKASVSSQTELRPLGMTLPFLSRLASEATGTDVVGNAPTITKQSIGESVRSRLQLQLPQGSLDSLDLEGHEGTEETMRKYMVANRHKDQLGFEPAVKDFVAEFVTKDSGYNEDEVRLLKQVAKVTGTQGSLWASKSLQSYISNMIQSGRLSNQPDLDVRGEYRGMFSDMADAIRLGRMRVTVKDDSDTLQWMKESKRNWEGDITSAPRAGLVYVANSEAWKTFLHDKGVLGTKAFARSMGVALAIVYARCPALSFDVLPTVAEWIEGTEVDLFPPDVVMSDIMDLGVPYELPYLRGDASHEKRQYAPQDSKYLLMAVNMSRRLFKDSTVKELKGHFKLDYHQLRDIDNKYGLKGK
nr:coat protein [Aspergillus ochraceopetaliformis chrysovirus 1]